MTHIDEFIQNLFYMATDDDPEVGTQYIYIYLYSSLIHTLYPSIHLSFLVILSLCVFPSNALIVEKQPQMTIVYNLIFDSIQDLDY